MALKEETIEFLFFAFINWSERCFIMGPVLGDRLVWKHRVVVIKSRNCPLYYLEAFLKFQVKNVPQKEEIIDFLVFAFINWSEWCFIMGPVLGDRLVWKHGVVVIKSRNCPLYYLEAFLKVSAEKRGSERRNHWFSIFRLYKLEWTLLRYGTCFGW